MLQTSTYISIKHSGRNFPDDDLVKDISDLFEDEKIPTFVSISESEFIDGVKNPYTIITQELQRINFVSHAVKDPVEKQVDNVFLTKVRQGTVLQKLITKSSATFQNF